MSTPVLSNDDVKYLTEVVNSALMARSYHFSGGPEMKFTQGLISYLTKGKNYSRDALKALDDLDFTLGEIVLIIVGTLKHFEDDYPLMKKRLDAVRTRSKRGDSPLFE